MGYPDDMELVRKASRGDEEAFEALVTRYEKQVYNLALRILLDPEDARDVVQDAFLRVYQKMSDFRGESSFSTWLYRVVVNLCLDTIRDRHKRLSYSLDAPGSDAEQPVQVADRKTSVEDEVESRVLMSKIASVLGDLSPEHRTILVLAHIKGLSYEEISQVTGIAMGTVKSRLARARWALRKLLSEPEEQAASGTNPRRQRQTK